jgi:hypothetical protein
MVSLAHRWEAGVVPYFRRMRIEMRAMAEIASLPEYRLADLVREWWNDLPEDRHSAFAHRFMNYRRNAGLLGKYIGSRDVRLASRDGRG